jgi:hypothetical protein
MAAVTGRTHRRGVGATSELRGRIRTDLRAKADLVATSTGVSLVQVLEWLIDQVEVDDRGVPRDWPACVPSDQRELPLKSA